MNEFLWEKKNIFQGKLLEDEKKRIKNILFFLKNEFSKKELSEKDYVKIKNIYAGLFEDRDKRFLKEKQILIETKNYLQEKIEDIIHTNNNLFLVKEIECELNEINILLEKYK